MHQRKLNLQKSVVAAAAMFTVFGFSSSTTLAQGLDCGCIDAVFVVDTSGSMGGAIANVKAGLAGILAVANQKSGGDLRVGVVQFSNVSEEINVVLPYTNNNAAITAAINSLSAGGGGGEPESMDDAVWYAVTGATNHACTVQTPSGALGAARPVCLKKTFVITDARPGGCDDTYTVGDDDVSSHGAAKAADATGWRINAIHVLNGFEDAVSGAILTDMATTSGGTYTEVPANGDGTANAILGKFLDCGGAGPSVPALSAWGVAALVLVVLAGLTIKFGRRTRVTA